MAPIMGVLGSLIILLGGVNRQPRYIVRCFCSSQALSAVLGYLYGVRGDGTDELSA
ncbi:MAG: hypothetical protein U5K84_06000 [Alkalibacterium sp.]|nr:hypothetical protein [Alkalibacterium sp.]